MGFLSPWFLGGLLALGVPVFVHLLKRHITVPRPMASLMFFERGTQSSTKHKRLKYLLLFALRASLLLLVVLAFANPFLRRLASDPAGRLMLIVLDNSFSMRAGTRFADAKQQALVLLAAKPASQKAQIVALGGQVAMLTQPIDDVVQLRNALEGVQPGDGHASFGELGRDIRALGEQTKGPADLHLFSDMQKSAMPANFADMVLPAETKLILHAVVKGVASPNWTVASVDAPAELADPKDTKKSRVLAVIAGLNAPAASKNVSLLVNGRSIATKRVDVPANGRATVEFAPLDIGYGFSKCEVRVDAADAFPLDDASVFAVRRSDPQKVLFVRGQGDTRSELYFGTALAAAAQASFSMQAASAASTNDLDPARFAFVVISDAVALPSIFERNLQEYVSKGGSVMIALGTGAGHPARIPLWGSEVKDAREYARAGGVATTVGQVDFTHPALADAQPGRDNGGWAETKILYASVVDPGNARVVARLSDGTPLLMDKSMGEGHVLLFTTGFDNLTNDLPLHPVFVAFVDRAARYLSGTERLSGSRLVDSFVQLRSGGVAAGASASAEVVDPAGKRPLSLEEARTARAFRLDHAGFYQVRFANGKDAVIGVNPDRLESDLQPMPDDTQQLWSGSNTAAPAEATQAAVAGDVKYRAVGLWWWVMLLALLVALAETFVSSGYMGTQREDA
ncbi:N-terminal double-transmembrane domain-containing protein [Terriglobus roseus DSM 18391]|uniref:N-terminal double-transmembrane domain-containing protein n=1 Tax=Terriglobus roseus (strain DSM 18391 / NRRL B-41598 / KBS 63) TaxID=926566 RepID=I3ZCE6_TERRK|nr:BatA and WFA domain-containing protein [Terriglobus roseus]AFL86914.1 N-terminal double-transmembrane domain-containing protein [Terriglobus roseus DSM 18391]